MTTIVQGTAGLRDLVGQHLGYSDWLEITQERVNLFAEATGDFQWIHVDPERAAKESPFGGAIAHGYLTLSLIPRLMPDLLKVEGIRMAVNYGCGKVRFPSPVPVGSNLRLGAVLSQLDDIDGGVQLYVTATLEVEGAAKPSCVAELIYRYYD